MAIDAISPERRAAGHGRMLFEDVQQMEDLPLQKLLVSIPEAGRILGISRSKLYDLLRSGNVPSVYIGRSRRIRIKDLESFTDQGGAQY
jgi:excisionase family DNA binding protein